jgi:hypothetical protein
MMDELEFEVTEEEGGGFCAEYLSNVVQRREQ